ncbi:hypothetical protein J7T55_009507 [Diaporthe amygdali]|uniref:uncharacterized protein n=1 Tax=Phomopsis amygdali TaxID=1214568 RepID=UPI0022FF1DD9|nr:uncharacterized protein J7T55_009507 [Diaporthe amygdali]KAJ0109177.1 hypothetical protein J7T55_009507 [Diaporthe amygdali]
MAREVPQEIWWLVCQDLKLQQDFRSLYRCALINRSWASLALPLLYSIHDSSSVASDDAGTTDTGRWAGMWRSIILSSLGVTAYPYCLWIRSLGLSDLEQLLVGIARDRKWRTLFFKGPMKTFEIISGSTKTRQGRPVLEWQKIIEQVGNKITQFAEEAAEKQNKSVQLVSLEGANLPTSLLSVWVSRLSTLTTLSIRDGSVLTAEVADSIHRNCPFFKDLTCFNIKGPTVDKNMSEFFRGLRENSLESFKVHSSNEIGYDALDGLMQHSRSLRLLDLSSLQNTGLAALDTLSRCQYLEGLSIEASTPSLPSTWAVSGEDPLPKVAAWLKECKSLRRLVISNLAGASKLLSDILVSPDLRLSDLGLSLIDDEEAFYTALGNQTALESLSLRSNAEIVDPNKARHDKFIDSICACTRLKDLDIMQKVGGIDQVQLTMEDLVLIQNSLPHLEELSFDGEYLTDALFEPLARMERLTQVSINGSSIFTFAGIKAFIEALTMSGTHKGFRLYVMNQYGEAEISERHQEQLAALMAVGLNGAFDLAYWRNPSEDDMSDLSD